MYLCKCLHSTQGPLVRSPPGSRQVLEQVGFQFVFGHMQVYSYDDPKDLENYSAARAAKL